MNDLEQMQQLANGMADGTASLADAARLSVLLRERPDLQDAYLSYIDIHAALCWEFRHQVAAASPARPSPSASTNPRRLGFVNWLPWVLTIAATIIAGVAWLQPGDRSRNESPMEAATKTHSIAALLVDEAGAEFAAGRGPDGIRFGPGDYELLKGVIQLRFAHGADLVLASPARLEVRDSLHVRLVYGKVRVVAPPTARGFTILTPAANYVDLGTEFGLRVEPETGASDLYVFDGQVNVEDDKSGALLREVREGSSSRYVSGVAGTVPELKKEEFPTPGAIGFSRWQDYEQQMRREPGLLAFYPFRRTANENVLANSHGNSTIADGRIVGARWASGRWPGKDALLFDRDSDFVGLHIPGEYQELTIALWIKLDRLDFELNSILNSDHADVGDVHLQLTRQGLPRGGIHGPKYVDKLIENPVRVGTWTHVAFVVSFPDRTQRTYVNGKLSRDRQLLGEGIIRPGHCRLGNWLPAVGWGNSTRAMRGRMDELTIWNRALAPDELVRLVESGRPSVLWGERLPDVSTPQ